MSDLASKSYILPAALTVPEAADYLRTSVANIYRMFGRGDLPKAKIGGRTLVRRIDADNLLARAAGAAGGNLFD